MAKQFFYSEQHIAFLRSGYMKMSVIALTAKFNAHFGLDKSVQTIHATLKNRGIKCGRNTGELMKGKPKVFTLAQKQWFIDNYPAFTRKALTLEFNRVFNENRKASQVIAFLKNNKINSGKTGRFEKGAPSWNKGTKGLMKANAGSFKKGQVAHNWLPVGSERVMKDGYLEVKTAEPHQWTSKHRLMWEAEYGPIPANHKVRFKNGVPSDIRLENLFLVNHAEHQHLNNMGFKDYPAETKDTLILIAKVNNKANEVRSRCC